MTFLNPLNRTPQDPAGPSPAARGARRIAKLVAASLLVGAGFATLGAAPASAATSTSENCQVHSDGVTHCEVTSCYTELGGLVDCVVKEYCYKKGTAQVTGCGDDSGDSTRGDGDLSANPPESRPGLKAKG